MKRNLTKAVRLIILRELGQHLRRTRTLQELADALGGVNRSTILRDLEDLDEIEAQIETARKELRL